MDPLGTPTFRKNDGAHTDETWICVAAGRLGWGRAQIEEDVYNQLFGRLKDETEARTIQRGMIGCFDKHVNISNLIRSIKSGYDSVKSFSLSPYSIFKMTYGMFANLAWWTFTERDLNMDMNTTTKGTDKYYNYLVYSYLTRGRVQPRYQAT